MSKINIIHWDDDTNYNSFGTNVQLTLDKYSVITNYQFHTNAQNFKNYVTKENFQLYILDIDENKKQKGFELFTFIAKIKKKSFSVLFLSDFLDDVEIMNKINGLKSKHKETIKIEVMSKEEQFSIEYYETVEKILLTLLDLEAKNINLIYDNEDYITLNNISIIGFENIKLIISNYFKLKEISNQGDIRVRSMTSGMSGAFILILEYGENEKLIKISNNFDQIFLEYENLILFSEKIRSIFKIDYERFKPSEISNNGNGWYSIIYEYVPSITFFSWLAKNNPNDQDIKNVLKRIFAEDGIRRLNKDEQESELNLHKNILSELNEKRKHFIENSYNNLVLLLEYKKEIFEFKKENVLDFVLKYHEYKYISNKNIPLQSIKYLSHNDLHANNILMDQYNNPIFIDPGSMAHKHLSSDICRLTIDLLIRGIDYETIDYYRLESIDKWFTQSKNLIDGKTIEFEKNDLKKTDIKNDSNNNFIFAINWLRSNVHKIYNNKFDEWEFQLSLAVEFLKASYKSIILPPGKRTLALMAGQYAIEAAEKTFRKKQA